MTLAKPSTQVKITIQEQSFDIKYPNSGEMIDIAQLKSKLSDGQYSRMLFQGSNESDLAIKLVDAFSFFSIMLPDLKKSLSVPSLYDLDILQSAELIHAYDNVITPFLSEWITAFNNKMAELKGENTGKRQLV